MKTTKTISKREQEILHLIAYEYTAQEMACKLFISLDTVKSHRKNLFQKLGVRNIAGAVRIAFEMKLIDLQINAA